MHGADRRLELGFLTFVAEGGSDGPGGALRDGLTLVQHAEDLGYDSAWVRVRHHEPFLSSPMTFFAAASQVTRRIALGTGVIPMRYEDPLRLAEDAATVDLLSGGRLELGLSNGIPPLAATLDPIHGASDRGFAGEAQHRIAILRRAIAGEPVAQAAAQYMGIPAGGDLTMTPHAPGLADRLWYGAGSEGTAVRAGQQGFDLQVSTLNTEETGETFDVVQARQIRSYRKAFADAGHSGRRSSRVSAGRIVLPFLDSRDAEAHQEFIEGYTSGMTADGRPTGDSPFPVRFSPVFSGDPDAIVERLLADEALPETDGLVIVLPAEGSLDVHRRVLSAVAEHVAPHLGWSPAG
ncbi:LLM class flavin-dependent oxidoreductase [Kineococcus rhizosphaerae]|uniref:Alkanesulfonate monooxygenase SsuD/methylene tetrahydromethanopterin reductase-like flavin-dependent oxidoreductase (Luciferase family) n=1 Tax=Kineococcus rhizosphaerae TaxID=559628 RepID=A0A2T0QX32_9ACTN|nr:LLM class flavin-dependent oxidoreductase [Kineococcus rhizosphaerae]PRY10271.1 alkanesulfonate monooxygenase SsuD/methylene tetrahydromethanopterin reductase-like flavin-dependent oxidoreductase (luciferase family) [Kineococcus rhizosphaerae]